MKYGRFSPLLLAALLFALLTTRPSFANDGPHGDYMPTTDECATCHRSHTSDGPHLLHSPAQDDDFCYTCHNGTGASAAHIISTHSNTDFASGVEDNFSLLCIQCHDPHGNNNLSIIKQDVWIQPGSLPITTGPVIFTSRIGLHSYDDGVSDTASRICTTCHTNTANNGYPMTYHSGGASHLGGQDYSGQNCISCHPHSADNDRATQDGFMPVGGGCVGCHSVPQDNGDGLPFGGRRAVIIDFENTSHHVLGTVEDDDCLACHNTASHGSGFVRLFNADDPTTIVTLNGRPDNDPASAQALEPFCLACHDSDGANGFAPFHDGFMPPIINETMWGNAAHEAASTCYDCHSNGHGSVKDNLLAPWNAVADGSLPGDPMREEEGLCYGCHAENQAEFELASHHNVSSLDQTDGSRLECISCHNPHTVNTVNPVSNPDHLAILWSGDETNFCLTCHDGYPPAGVAFPSAIGTGFNKSAYNGSTHAVPLGDYGCRHCHDQHGSSNTSLLGGQYATADYTPYAASSYQLCWTCHNENGTIWGMNRFRNQHGRHVNTANTPCIVCHDVHAPHDSGEIGLINFDYGVLSGYDILYLAGYDGGSAFSIDLAFNRGSCSIACHGRNHPNRNYMRGAAVPTDCTACHPGGPPITVIIDSIFPIMPLETPTETASPTITPTATLMSTITPTMTMTATPTIELTSTISSTVTAVPFTPAPSFTPTPSSTPTLTIVPTSTPTLITTGIPTSTASPTTPATSTTTATSTITPTPSPPNPDPPGRGTPTPSS